MLTTIKALAAASLIFAAMPAAASTTFNTTTVGDPYTDTGPSGSNTVKFTDSGHTVTITGYQLSQGSPPSVNTAHVGVYSPGIGVTGNGDFGGLFNYHQIDNVNGYTDFVLLTFDSAVTLDTIGIKSFVTGFGPYTAYDNDLSFQALTSPFNASNINNTGWTTIYGNGSQTSVSTGSSAVSNQWLVGAAVDSPLILALAKGNKPTVDDKDNDGFKISSLTVRSAVPEPATWGMMLIGFGAVGASMRRRRPALARQAA